MDWEMLGKQGSGSGQAQPAAVPKSQVQAQVQPIANVAVPKLKHRTRRPVGRPRKVKPNSSSVEETMTSLRFTATAFGSDVVTVHQTSLLHGDSSTMKSPR